MLGCDIMLIRPGEQLKLCEKNFAKEKLPVPIPRGGMKIEEFDLFNKEKDT